MAGCSSPQSAPAAQSVVALSPVAHKRGINSVSYSGRWEFENGRTDGRYLGASARSFHAGACMTILFRGTRLRIFGVIGRNGGAASVVFPPRGDERISFVGAAKTTHRLVYDSGPLQNGVHIISVVVMKPTQLTQGYVNIDELEIGSVGS
jgi:hypothetical protein